jgi:hypothetical protein
MTMQSDNRGRGLATILWAQLGLLVVVAAIVLALAWQYVW